MDTSTSMACLFEATSSPYHKDQTKKVWRCSHLFQNQKLISVVNILGQIYVHVGIECQTIWDYNIVLGQQLSSRNCDKTLLDFVCVFLNAQNHLIRLLSTQYFNNSVGRASSLELRGREFDPCIGNFNKGVWPNFLVWSPPWYCIVSPLLKTKKWSLKMG